MGPPSLPKIERQSGKYWPVAGGEEEGDDLASVLRVREVQRTLYPFPTPPRSPRLEFIPHLSARLAYFAGGRKLSLTLSTYGPESDTCMLKCVTLPLKMSQRGQLWWVVIANKLLKHSPPRQGMGGASKYEAS